MKSVLGIVSSTIIVAVPSGTAAAQDRDDWYVSAAGTISLLDNSDTQVLNLPIPTGRVEMTNRFNTGAGLQVAVGRSVGPVRLEAEGGYTRNKSDRYDVTLPPNGELSGSGGHKAWRLMANAYYDLGNGALRPYIGAGAGYTSIKARLFGPRAAFPTETPRLILDDRKGKFAYQAMAGAAYEVAPGFAVTAQYRWLSAGKVSFRDVSGFEHRREHNGHNIDLGVRFGF